MKIGFNMTVGFNILSPLQKSTLYEQLYKLMLGRIRNGEWSKGSYIPNEFDLGHEFKVSVGTVRKAVDLLVNENLLIRRQGKGTMVAEGRWIEVGERFNTIRHSSVGKNISWVIRELDFHVEIGKDDVASQLQLRQNDEVSVLKRTRTALGMSIYEIIFYPTKLFLDNQFDESEHGDAIVLCSRNGHVIGRVEERMIAMAATQDLSRLMSIKENTPILKIERNAFKLDDCPIEYKISYVNVGDGFIVYSTR